MTLSSEIPERRSAAATPVLPTTRKLGISFFFCRLDLNNPADSRRRYSQRNGGIFFASNSSEKSLLGE
jgi:hypothetical protein